MGITQKSNMINQLPNVAVLLATHNPPGFIDQQIESIKRQFGVKVKIYWGDYGSSKETKNHIRILLNDIEFIEFEIRNPGPAKNFFELLKNADEEYISFSDQDDIWLPNKLFYQVNQLKKTPHIPSLTHSTAQILKNGKVIPRKSLCLDHKFNSLALSNCCQGCTLMINSAAKKVILDSLPEKIIWHDWWMGLVISVTGIIHYSPHTEVLYRIHHSNTIGIPSNLKKILLSIKRPSGLVSFQIHQILKNYSINGKILNQELTLINDLTSNSIMRRLNANIRVKKREALLQYLLRRILWTIKKP